ncbi:MAG: type II toxin-antitoxin system RelE/ParE family toxin [Actinomycetaceae bacterium]|nr:type II toxin-antitoxin system RelE/ParE family toxin [Actinomycetaceae bacterium]
MGWKVEVSEKARSELRKIDPRDARRITDYLQALTELEDPRIRGKALKGDLGDYWRYRVGNYRVICDLKQDVLTILVLRTAHRRKVYKHPL